MFCPYPLLALPHLPAVHRWPVSMHHTRVRSLRPFSALCVYACTHTSKSSWSASASLSTVTLLRPVTRTVPMPGGGPRVRYAAARAALRSCGHTSHRTLQVLLQSTALCVPQPRVAWDIGLIAQSHRITHWSSRHMCMAALKQAHMNDNVACGCPCQTCMHYLTHLYLYLVRLGSHIQ